MTALLHQRCHQCRLIELDVEYECGWNEFIDVVLRKKRLQHFNGDCIFRSCDGAIDMRWKIRTIPQMSSTAHHRQIDAGTSALHDYGNNVDIGIASSFHRLLMQHTRQCRDLITHCGRLLESQLFCIGLHFCFQCLHDLVLPPTQEFRSVLDIDHIVFLADCIHAWCAASLNLM